MRGIIKKSKHTITYLPDHVKVNSDGYLVSGDKAVFSTTKVNVSKYTKEELSKLRFADLTDEQKTLVWKINEEFEGEKIEYIDFCDEKTDKYLESVARNIGYVETLSGYEEEAENNGYILIEKVSKHNGYINSSDVDILKFEKDNKTYWGMEYGVQTDIDDYVVITHVFNKKPGVDILRVADDLSDTLCKIKINRWDDIVKCWECGREFHWLDGTGVGLSEKLKNKDEKYCGC